MNIQWDADKYTNNFSFVHRYGNDVMDLIDFENASTAIDLGCGNGALTEVLKKKGLSAIGIDSSRDMLEVARKCNTDITFILADATDFSVEEPVDVVFANAVFHWIDKDKQSDMLRCVSKALKPGGQFVFEFGGYGNNALIHGALEKVFAKYEYEYKMPFYFPSIGEYASLVEQAGFTVQTAVLFDRPTELYGKDGLKDWIGIFLLTPFDVIPDWDLKEQIKDQVVEDLREVLYKDGKWYADYVRLRMKAVKK